MAAASEEGNGPAACADPLFVGCHLRPYRPQHQPPPAARRLLASAARRPSATPQPLMSSLLPTFDHARLGQHSGQSRMLVVHLALRPMSTFGLDDRAKASATTSGGDPRSPAPTTLSSPVAPARLYDATSSRTRTAAGDVPGPDPARAPLARRLPGGFACRGQQAGIYLARSATRSAAAPTSEACLVHVWATCHRNPAVASGTSLAQVIHAILREPDRVQNPEKDEFIHEAPWSTSVAKTLPRVASQQTATSAAMTTALSSGRAAMPTATRAWAPTSGP
jgi:hypothetical protein